MKANAVKSKLRAGDAVYGCFVRHPAPGLFEVMSLQGWDFIVIDGEHGTADPADCENITRAIELHDATPIVRVTTNQRHIILRYLDAGPLGLIVPWVSSRADAELVVEAVKYHPRGSRGLAFVRAGGYGQFCTLPEYIKWANRELLITVQVETVEAVDNLPDIVAVDEIDVVFIGPSDLSHSYGAPGNLEHPCVQKALNRIVDVVTSSDKALGIMVSNATAAQEWRDRGARFIAIGFEALLRGATRAYLDEARG